MERNHHEIQRFSWESDVFLQYHLEKKKKNIENVLKFPISYLETLCKEHQQSEMKMNLRTDRMLGREISWQGKERKGADTHTHCGAFDLSEQCWEST